MRCHHGVVADAAQGDAGATEDDVVILEVLPKFADGCVFQQGSQPTKHFLQWQLRRHAEIAVCHRDIHRWATCHAHGHADDLSAGCVDAGGLEVEAHTFGMSSGIDLDLEIEEIQNGAVG